MNEDSFWKLIETSIDRGTLNELGEDDYPEELVQPLIENLATLSIQEIQQFEEFLARALYNLDGDIFADNAGESGKSDDGFLYCRCWIVANGRMYYESIVEDPEKMPKTISEWCEPLLYVTSQAWAQQTGNDSEDWDYTTTVSYETGSNKALWKG